MLGPILFNFDINDLSFFIKQATLYNYADDNTLAYFSKSMPHLINILEKETGVALNWSEQNEMIANPEKCQALLLYCIYISIYRIKIDLQQQQQQQEPQNLFNWNKGRHFGHQVVFPNSFFLLGKRYLNFLLIH